jgi:rod shape-determining protein MreD
LLATSRLDPFCSGRLAPRATRPEAPWRSCCGRPGAAALLQVAATWIYPGWPVVVDLFLVVTVIVARSGRPLQALLAGVAAGWTADALAGGPLGINGFADSAVGYAAALVAQHLVVHRRSSLAGVFAAAAAAQGAMLALLGTIFLAERELPGLEIVALRAATSALAGLVWTQVAGAVGRRFRRRRGRPSGALNLPKSLLP